MTRNTVLTLTATLLLGAPMLAAQTDTSSNPQSVSTPGVRANGRAPEAHGKKGTTKRDSSDGSLSATGVRADGKTPAVHGQNAYGARPIQGQTGNAANTNRGQTAAHTGNSGRQTGSTPGNSTASHSNAGTPAVQTTKSGVPGTGHKNAGTRHSTTDTQPH